ncbi:hypothetical protein V2W45_1468999 [Cenococcum geophilum]
MVGTPQLILLNINPRYKTLLKTKGSFICKYIGINKEETEQKVPNNSLFNDNIFNKTYNIIDGRNKAKALAIYSAKLKYLIKTIYYIYFPFLTYKVKYGATALNIIDRQNAYSITLVVRAIVKLFRLIKLRIYGHYPIIKGKDTTYYRHPIYTFNFTALDRKEKIRSIINNLPSNFNFKLEKPESLPGERNS